jgi:hypothetical protein
MTRKEFEDRTGITDFTDEYYHNVIEEGYYRSDMDKDAYCAAVAPLVGNPLLKAWVGRMTNASACIDIYRREQQEDAELMLDIAEQIRDTAEGQAKVLEDRAAERMGRKGMILYKVARSIELTADDLDYLKNNLR